MQGTDLEAAGGLAVSDAAERSRPSKSQGTAVDIMMPHRYHHGVRTTLTLDDDVVAKLRARVRGSGKPFREIVNEALRRGLAAPARAGKRPPFVVRARDLGDLKPGLTLDNVGALLEEAEGPLHR